MLPARSENVLRACLDDEAFEHVRLTVRGACMEPCAAEGEAVRLVPLSRRRARFGDVVLVRTRDGLRLHRLVWPPRPSAGRRARTMADRARSLDPAVPFERVLGVAVGVERAGRVLDPRRRGLAARALLRAAWTRLRRAAA